MRPKAKAGQPSSAMGGFRFSFGSTGALPAPWPRRQLDETSDRITKRWAVSQQFPCCWFRFAQSPSEQLA